MANNRLILCEVDYDNSIVASRVIGKNMGGEWYCTDYQGAGDYVESINSFFMDAFINGNGIALKDEYMEVPLPPLFVYNNEYEGKGHWEFVKEKDDGKDAEE